MHSTHYYLIQAISSLIVIVLIGVFLHWYISKKKKDVNPEIIIKRLWCRWIYAMTSIAPAATRAFTRTTPLLRRWKNSFRSTIQRALPSQRFFCLSKEVQFLMQATSGLIFLFCRHRISFLFQKIQKPALYLYMVYIHQI